MQPIKGLDPSKPTERRFAIMDWGVAHDTKDGDVVYVFEGTHFHRGVLDDGLIIFDVAYCHYTGEVEPECHGCEPFGRQVYESIIVCDVEERKIITLEEMCDLISEMRGA